MWLPVTAVGSAYGYSILPKQDGRDCCAKVSGVMKVRFLLSQEVEETMEHGFRKTPSGFKTKIPHDCPTWLIESHSATCWCLKTRR